MAKRYSRLLLPALASHVYRASLLATNLRAGRPVRIPSLAAAEHSRVHVLRPRAPDFMPRPRVTVDALVARFMPAASLGCGVKRGNIARRTGYQYTRFFDNNSGLLAFPRRLAY